MTDKPLQPERDRRDTGRRRRQPDSTGARGSSVGNQTDAPRLEPAIPGDLVGRTLGDFRLKRLLGRGGMAEVYLAEQVSLSREVAVKVLRASLMDGTDDVAIRRFQQEAYAAAGLSHPGIVQVYGVGSQDGIHYIAQEFVDGVNLREYLSRKGPPAVPRALRIIRQAAMALQIAGEAGIVHRDIKPENIMITRRGEVKVADFGLARLVHNEERGRLTQEGVTMGTPLYMSPEQVNGQPCDQRSDIYSLGVTSYHLLSGKPPFRGETALSIAVQHLNSTPPPLAETRANLPPAVCQLVHRMMARDPADRYQTAADLLADLRKLALAERDEPGSLQQVSLSPGPSADAINWKKLGGSLALASLLTVSTAALLGWLLRPSDPLQTPPATAREATVLYETAAAQYVAALEEDSEAGWNALIRNFRDPQDSQYVTQAQQQLALLLLRQSRLDEAEALFQQIERTAVGDEAWRARGQAGRAIVLNRRGKYAESATLLDTLASQATRSIVNEGLLDMMLEQTRTSNDRNMR